MDNLLTSYPPPVVSIVDHLKELIHQVAPDVKEKANPGWRNISYLDSQAGNFCEIFPFEEHVDLIFEFGSLLSDPEGILQGDTKQTRHIRFYEPEDVDVETIELFLLAALDLPPSHSARRDLTQNKP